MNALRFSTEANLDVDEIANYLFELNPVAAFRCLDAPDTTCELLSNHPLIGRLRPALGEGLRSFSIGNYILFYLPASDGIDVVRIIYGGRNLPKILRK